MAVKNKKARKRPSQNSFPHKDKCTAPRAARQNSEKFESLFLAEYVLLERNGTKLRLN